MNEENKNTDPEVIKIDQSVLDGIEGGLGVVSGSVHCKNCGKSIMTSEYNKNGGLCRECAS